MRPPQLGWPLTCHCQQVFVLITFSCRIPLFLFMLDTKWDLEQLLAEVKSHKLRQLKSDQNKKRT